MIDHFKAVFSEDLVHNEKQSELESEIKLYAEKIEIESKEGLNRRNFCINNVNIKSVISEFKTSNTRGWDGITYNMLQRCGEQALGTISSFLGYVMNYSIIPKNFNMSIIKPILKDPKKISFDLVNLRPISVSNCLAQIFEKIIVKTNPKLIEVNNNQFGFRKGLSTIHPLFILKESSLWAKKVFRYYD